MTRQRPIPKKELDALVARAEEMFAQAIKRAFNAAASAVRHSVTAAAGEPFVSVDDASIANTVWQREMESLVPIVAEAYTSAALGVMGSSGPLELPPTVPAVLNQAAADHLATARNRIARLGDDSWSAVRGSLLTGFEKGESIPKLSARIQREANITAARARTVARTEIIGASNAGAYTGARAAPAELRPATKEWLATMDDRTRESHAEANGQVVGVDDYFDVGGTSLRYPGDEYAPAEEIVNCRCTILFDTGDGAEEIGPDELEQLEDQIEESENLNWSPTMSAADADAYTADSVITGPKYHGTMSGAEGIRTRGFDPALASTATGNYGQYGNGIYFTSNQRYAQGYAGSGEVLETRILMKNPMPQNEFFDLVAEEKLMFSQASSLRVTEYAQSKGYDGIRIVPNEKFPDFDEIVVFDPKQIVVVT